MKRLATLEIRDHPVLAKYFLNPGCAMALEMRDLMPRPLEGISFGVMMLVMSGFMVMFFELYTIL